MAVIVREKKKGSGEWWVFINHKGRRRSKKVGTKTAANKVAREVEERLAKGDMGLVKARCPTLLDYGKKWLGSPLHPWQDSTRKVYKGAFNGYIKPALGNKRLDEIKRRHIKELIGQLKAEGKSSSRVRTVTEVLSGIYNSAIEDEVVEVNPCQRMGKYTGYEAKGEINPLEANEVTVLLQNAHQRLSFCLYALILLAVRTGLRIGEILALEWADVDFEARVVEVTKAWNYKRNIMGPPKNKKPRKVDLTPQVIDALKRLKASSKVLALAIFADERGQRLEYKAVQDAFKQVVPRPVRFHDLRHSYATLRLAKGDDVVDVSNQLGHHSVAFTLNTYAHWMPGKQKAQVDELDEVAPACTPAAP
jgi:integrase